MPMIRNIYLILSLFLLSQTLYGQSGNSRFRNYGIMDGLSQTSVDQVFQDKKGFMWFVTSDGLNKFDGYRFIAYKYDYKNPNSLSDSWVSHIFMEDSDNELWLVTTDQVIHKFNLQTNEFKRFFPSQDDSTGILPFDKISSITEDYQKNIWISTTSGVFRYDKNKQRFFHFKQLAVTSRNSSFQFFEDSKGSLWCYGLDGLYRYSHKSDYFLHLPFVKTDSKSVASDSILGISEDNSQNLYILSSNAINKFNREKGTFTRYYFDFKKLGKSTNAIPYLLKTDEDGNLWIGTTAGLMRFVPETAKFDYYSSIPSDPTSLSGNYVYRLFLDKAQQLWVSTSNGLNKYQKNEKSGYFKRFEPTRTELKNSIIANIFQDRTGDIWALHYMQPGRIGLLSKVDTSRSVIDLSNETNFNPSSFWVDKTGNVWLGSFDNGVTKFTAINKNFENFQRIPDNPSTIGGSSVWGFAEDENSNIWLSLYNQGFDKFDAKTGLFTHFKPSLISKKGTTTPVFSITPAANDIIYISTLGGGVLKMNTKTGAIKQYLHNSNDPYSIANNMVRKLVPDGHGNFWVTLFYGFDFFDVKNDRFTHFLHEPKNQNSLSNNVIWDAFQDSQGDLWISSAGAGFIDRYNTQTKQFTHYRSKSSDSTGLLANKALSIIEDKQGNIWFGTGGGGLSLFNKKTSRFKHWTETDGLPNNTIYGIVEDDAGFLWLSTNQGLSRFDPKKETFVNFDVSNGLQSNEFNMGAYLKDRHGRLYFGGINGFNRFDPHHFVKDTTFSEVALTSFQILNKEIKTISPEKRYLIDAANPDKIIRMNQALYLPKSITYLKRIVLSHQEKVITLEFAALDYRNPEKTKYRYRMDNFDKDWNYSGNRRFVTYTNLPPGKYVFQVTSTNPDGLWNPNPTELLIEITPPFWLTWWFIAIEIIALTGIIIGIVRIRERNLKLAKDHLEEKVKKRTHEIEEKNEELKIRNIQILKQKEEIASQAKQLKVELVSQNQASELALLRSQINPHFLFNTLNNIYSLVYQRTDSAPEAVMRLSEIMRYMLYEASAEKVCIDKEINYLKSFIDLQALRLKNKDFVQFNISGDYSALTISPMLLIPFVENAFKHGIKKGHNPGIIINLIVNSKKLTFEVTNFCSKNAVVNKDQTGGIGLPNIKRRLELLYLNKYDLQIVHTEETFQVKLEIEEL